MKPTMYLRFTEMLEPVFGKPNLSQTVRVLQQFYEDEGGDEVFTDPTGHYSKCGVWINVPLVKR